MKLNKETIICKFDNEIECTSYNCEYTCSELNNLELDGEESCPLFKREQFALNKVNELESRIKRARNIVKNLLVDSGAVSLCQSDLMQVLEILVFGEAVSEK